MIHNNVLRNFHGIVGIATPFKMPVLRFSKHVGRLCSSHIKSRKLSSKPEENNVKSHQAAMMSRGLPKKQAIPGVENILLVASGKGGVGKSTTAVNLAVALNQEYPNKEIGLLDADIFGPSLPLLMNLHEEPLTDSRGLIIPLTNYGVKCMSMGLLVKEGAPIAWRGLMVMQAIQRLTRGVAWGPLDLLIIDTPPGTGDSMISLAQTLPLRGALIVTTPHTIAAQVVRRGAALLNTMGVPVAGIVRNMTGAICPKCGSDVPLSTLKDAKEVFELGSDVKIYCDIPTHPDIADAGDNGVPIVASNPDGTHGSAYRSLARSVVSYLDNLKAKSSDNVQ